MMSDPAGLPVTPLAGVAASSVLPTTAASTPSGGAVEGVPTADPPNGAGYQAMAKAVDRSVLPGSKQ